MAIFYKKWEKYNEIQLTKSKMDLNIRKITNHPPSPSPTIPTYKMKEEKGKEYKMKREPAA